MMLKRLYDWRIGCSTQQLLDFETELTPVCMQDIGEKTLNERYNGRFHCALLNQKTLLAAVQIIDGATGEKFARKIANLGGIMALADIKAQHKPTLLTLKKRGIVWLHDHHICMPAEFVLMLRKNRHGHDWITLCDGLPKLLLQHLMPKSIGFIANGTPMQHEMAASLLCQGLQSLASISSPDALDDKDWDLLCYLDLHGAIDSIKPLQRFCPDAIDAKQIHARLPSQSHSSGRKNKSAVESALEEYFPKRLKKLLLLGLIGLIIKNHNESSTQLVLSKEAGVHLASFWESTRKRIADQGKDSWDASPCEIGIASPWLHEHDLWRIWLALHFMPLRRTQQGHFYKKEMRQLFTLLRLDHEFPINMAISCLLRSNFLDENDAGEVSPATINWAAWAKRQFNLIINWTPVEAEQRMAAQLLLELPVNKWLKLEHVTTWLNAKSKDYGALSHAPWGNQFTRFPDIALHHLDTTGRCIYLLPAFHAVLSGDIAQSGQTPFASPGWKGGEESAIETGFINAAGDIQLPPEFRHSTLGALNAFCTITSVEHQITLHINAKEISRTTLNKSQIIACKTLLESIQSPLPQAIAYLFDKQIKLESVAHIESTSLLIMLQKPADAQRIDALGFPVRQPFPDLPQVMLLEDGIYAHEFVSACLQAGIVLDTGAPPKQWIEGADNIFNWVHEHAWKTEGWLELCYSQHSGMLKQDIVHLNQCSYASFKVRLVEKHAHIYVLSRNTIRIESGQISRLRALNATEIKQRSLDKLL